MSALTKICLCLLALISLAPSWLGQQQGGPPPPTQIPAEMKEKARRELDYVRTDPEQVIKTVGAAKISFNWETKRKKAFVSLPKVAGAPGGGIDLTASFFYEGGAAKPSEVGAFKPVWFNVEFTADRSSFGPSSNREVAVESDGQRFAFGDALEQSQQPGVAARVVLKKSVLYESFVRAFGGKSVTVHLGTFSFELGEAERKAVRDLIKLTEEAPR